MSKHPTSELSPRDLACIEYGKWLASLRREWLMRLDNRFVRGYARQVVRMAREARGRIFRNCWNCALLMGNSVVGYRCVWQDPICDETEACTCDHYEERRESHGR